MLSATLVLAGSLAGANPPQSVLLRYKFRLGESQTYSYEIDSKEDMGHYGSMAMKMQATIKLTVVKIAPNGEASIKGKYLSETATMGGKPMSGGASVAGKTFTMDMAPNGKPSNMKIPGMQQLAAKGVDLSGMQFGTVLPTRPVQVGSHWVGSANLTGLGDIQVNATLKKIYSRGGATMADVSAGATMDMSKLVAKMLQGKGMTASGEMHMTVHYTMNVTRGLVDSMNMSGISALTMRMPSAPQGQPSSMKMDGLQRVSMKFLK